MNLKKAEITTQQIVMLIILIASFIVILFFVFQLGLGKTTDKEVCHNSVVTRSSSVLPEDTIPLNCKTHYICITEDGSCEGIVGADSERVDTADDVYEVLATEMADCWWMFGEGKLNYVGKEFESDLYCSICSQISFDDSLNKIFENDEIDQKTFYEYLGNKKISDKGINYLNYLFGVNSISEMENILKQSNSEFGKIGFGDHYYVVMGIYSDVGAENWAIAGGAVGLVFGGPVGMIIGGVIGGVAAPILGTVRRGTDSGHDVLSPTIIKANSEDFSKLKCKDIKTLA